MPFTYNYSQPEEYHFSLDSIEMPAFVAGLVAAEGLRPTRVLDLCSGCGVIGLEFHFHCPEISELHFLESQREPYELHVAKNLALIPKQNAAMKIHWGNFRDFEKYFPQQSFDLILCNPPYFELGDGKLSPSDFKNRCRFYMDGNLDDLAHAIEFCLAPEGNAFILMRRLADHKKDLYQRFVGLMTQDLISDLATKIRGTELLRIRRPAKKISQEK